MAEDSRGLFDSLTAFASTLVSIAHTRLALLSNDLEEDRARLFSLVLLYVAAMFFLVVGVVLAIILVVYILWESHRLLALSSLAGLFLLLGAGLCITAMRKSKAKPKLFSSSLSELIKDKDRLDAHE